MNEDLIKFGIFISQWDTGVISRNQFGADSSEFERVRLYTEKKYIKITDIDGAHKRIPTDWTEFSMTESGKALFKDFLLYAEL